MYEIKLSGFPSGKTVFCRVIDNNGDVVQDWSSDFVTEEVYDRGSLYVFTCEHNDHRVLWRTNDPIPLMAQSPVQALPPILLEAIPPCELYSKGQVDQYQIGSYRAGVLMIALVCDFESNPFERRFFSEITYEVVGEGYEAGGKRLIKRTPYRHNFGGSVLLVEDVTWEHSMITANGAIVYEFTGDASTSPILQYIDFHSWKLTCDGDFTLQWPN